MTVYSKRTKKGTHWYWQFIRNGQYHRGGGYPTKQGARDAEAVERQLVSPQAGMVFGIALEKYLDYVQETQSLLWYQQKRDFIKDYLSHLKERDISEITAEDIREVITRKQIERSGYMANKYLKFAKAIFNFAAMKKWILENPANEVKRVGEIRRVKHLPTPEEFNKILGAARLVDRQFLVLLFTLAARTAEILALKWTDIENGWVILRTRKHQGGQIREDRQKLSPLALEALGWMKERTGDREYVFCNPRTQEKYDRRPKLIRGLCKKAGVPFFTLHAIRSFAASCMDDAGTPLSAIQDKLRHQRLSTTDHYVKSLQRGKEHAESVLDGVINEG
jgi:integrase